MERKRWVTMMVGGAFALAAMAAATPAAADDGGAAAYPSPKVFLESHWYTDKAGKVSLALTLRNRGPALERPWLQIYTPGVPASAWWPACLEYQDVAPWTMGVASSGGLTRCRLAPLAEGEVRHVEMLAAKFPVTRIGTIQLVVAGDDGNVNQTAPALALRLDPVGATYRIAPRQHPTRGLKVVVRALRPGAAEIVVAVRRSADTTENLYLRGVARFAKPGRRTVTLKPRGPVLRQLRYALRHGTAEASFEATYRPADGMQPTYDRQDLRFATR